MRSLCDLDMFVLVVFTKNVSFFFFMPFALTSFIREYYIRFQRLSGSIRGVAEFVKI